MKRMVQSAAGGVILFVLAGAASAATITYDFTKSGAVVAQRPLVFTVDGVQFTAVGIVGNNPASTTEERATRQAQGLGVRDLQMLPDGTVVENGIDAIDGVGRDEQLKLTFDLGQVLQLISFDLQGVESNDDLGFVANGTFVGGGQVATGMGGAGTAALVSAGRYQITLTNPIIGQIFDLRFGDAPPNFDIAANDEVYLRSLTFATLPSVQTVSNTPLPPALWLFGSGFAGLVYAARRRRGQV